MKKMKWIGSCEREALTDDDIIRVTGLWLGNEHNEVLLAKRSHRKKRDPRKWGLAVAGTVEVGETYLANILKESP